MESGIECGIHYYPNHWLTKYRTDYHLPVTEKIYEEILTLPCHLDLNENAQNHVISKIKSFMNQYYFLR